MQGVFTKFLQLWIPNKTDKGTVVTDVFEPNFTKLDQNAESVNKTLDNLSNNKLDKGTYPGNASDLNTEISKIASTTQLGRIIVGDNLTVDSNGRMSGNPAVDISGKLDKGTYSGNAGNLKAEIDGKVSKSGDTMTGILTISGPKYPEIIFDNIERVAVGYSVDEKLAYFRGARSVGLRLYENNIATLQANNLNTKNKEVVAAINELNSRGFVKIGECLIVNQSVSIYGYNEFVVCEKYSLNTIIDIKYFTKDIVNSLKSFNFVSYASSVECKWVFSADGNTITLKDLGSGDDSGIYVYGR